MNNYILIAVSVVIMLLMGCMICRTWRQVNIFTTMKPDFQKEGQVQGFEVLLILKLLSYLIHQTINLYQNSLILILKGFQNICIVETEPNSNYTITYWRANDDLYNAKNYDIEFYNGDSKVDTEGHTVYVK